MMKQIIKNMIIHHIIKAGLRLALKQAGGHHHLGLRAARQEQPAQGRC
jgi:hypothetical protein